MHSARLSARPRAPRAVTVIIPALIILLGGGRASAAPPAGQETDSKLHPSLLERFAAAPNERVKAWIFFTDKGHFTPSQRQARVSKTAARYNPRAARRRQLRGGPALGKPAFTVADLPVRKTYIDAVAEAGATIGVKSRWFNAISAQVTEAQAERIASLSFVQALQPVASVAPPPPLNPVPAQIETDPHPWPPGPGDEIDYGIAADQLNQIDLPALHRQGYTGQGIIVGILDTGFRLDHEAFNNPAKPLNVIAQYDFVNDDPNVDFDPGDAPGQYSHGTLILGSIAGYKPGTFVGGAYDASVVLAKTENAAIELPVEEDWFVAGLEFIESNGADLATSSLVSLTYNGPQLDGETSLMAQGVNIATSHGVHFCQAAGNSGHDADPATSTINTPADALEAISVGAVSATGAIAGFSSDGPTFDGRVKPEVLARGVNTYSVSHTSPSAYAAASGTSLAAPLVASAVACIVQAHPDWTVAQLRQRLFHTADYFTAHGTYDPTFVRGYGIIDAAAAAGDCNSNGLPDECDADCGAPGGPCDVPGCGLSADCNTNLQPDECELAENDCNSNSVPDDCDNAALIVQQPADALVCPGDMAVMTVLVASEEGNAYAWYKDGTRLTDNEHVAGSATATLVIGPVQAGDAGDYTCHVERGCLDAESAAGHLTVATLGTITQQPVAVYDVCAGAAAIFTVQVEGASPPPSFHWYADGVALTNDGKHFGAGTAMLRINDISPADAGRRFTCVISNDCASVASHPGTVRIVSPMILTPPRSTCAQPGQDVTLTVEALSPTGDVFYQWRKEGVTGAIGSGPALSLTNVDATDEGAYYALAFVLDPTCVTESPHATLAIPSQAECWSGLPGDMDADGDYDLADMQRFFLCYGQDPRADLCCACADLDGASAVVDGADWETLESEVTGPR